MFTEPQVEQRAAQPYMGIRSVVTMEELGAGLIPRLHGEVMQWLNALGAAPSGAPLIRYYAIDMARSLDVDVGWPVAAPLPGDDRVQAAELPAGRYAALVYTGIENGIAGNKALLDWIAEHELAVDVSSDPAGDAFGGRYEAFLTEPADEPDMAKWETEVAIRLADEAGS